MQFFCVYIREAHPEDEWQVPMNYDDEAMFMQPTTMDERAGVAQACILRLQLDMPTLLDTMDDEVDTAYAALPDRLYVVDAEGAVSYQSAPGPFGFNSDEWEAAIKATLGGG